MNKFQSLTPEILRIVDLKGTEYPRTGKYDQYSEIGTYLCRRCGLALFRADQKFLSSCGWPSFDDEIAGTILRQVDADGRRTEILCHRCKAHLGHVFTGEYLTEKNLRHCVNSLSLDFVYSTSITDSAEAIFAGGCFWGVEYYLRRLAGVVFTEVGYCGGHTAHPNYQNVCNGNTGHIEAIRVIFDPALTDFETVTRAFFEIHDPTQVNRQGPDIGEQYQSAIFYYDEAQKLTAESLIKELTTNGYQVATKLLPVSVFWAAEDYHQGYYEQNGKQPYCHSPVKRFGTKGTR